VSELNPRERAGILKQVKDLNRKIQDPRLSISRVEELHRQREQLHARLMADRASR
jgi:hypothetical protein